ncbi:MAG: outer membrane lipoprotein carrier protein LolA [Gammaproteobacteria bacterium]|nr:outer membrane lipoprotein carrier protein LolA [Gammaproteobacteria bacterium]
MAQPDNGALQQLAGLLKSSDAYYANFQHELRDEEGQLLDASSGWMAWQRPTDFRWEIEQPLAQTLLVKGSIFYQYDRDLEQMLVQPLSEEVAVLPQLLLAGDVAVISARYRVTTVLAVAAQPGVETELAEAGQQVVHQPRPPKIFKLRPHQPGEMFRELLLEFRGSALTAINISDDLQQNSRFEFTPRQDAMGAGLFEVNPPPATEIIYQ